jgi:acetoin utilization deacetylase AcuC-like enzyme
VGSKGTWTAAVCSVASAVYAVDLVVMGECVNAFCATRPPGHHAGRRLHPMKAVSNGFCILNAVACAAIYAATPVADGGIGLRRVCIIDFDAHHGNGTQDILCSIYDPRFLYISIHAGGPDVNGTEIEGVGPKSTGIYPGSCGDTSPHAGVLNIPLGLQVTPHGVGMALLHRINPRVDQFCPDLIIVSAGFDAHKNDPMGLGNLRSADFFTITDSICTMARKHCNGRLVSVMEGGYGVPCCREQRNDLFLPASERDNDTMSQASSQADGKSTKMDGGERKQPSALADLGPDLPDDMEDQVPYALQVRLDKCHEEGFVECVKEHVRALLKNNVPS